MDKNWLAFIIGFVVIIIFITSATCIYKSFVCITDVLRAPALTSNITIERLTIQTQKTEYTSPIAIEIENFSAEVNSKFIDLLILSAK